MVNVGFVKASYRHNTAMCTSHTETPPIYYPTSVRDTVHLYWVIAFDVAAWNAFCPFEPINIGWHWSCRDPLQQVMQVWPTCAAGEGMVDVWMDSTCKKSRAIHKNDQHVARSNLSPMCCSLNITCVCDSCSVDRIRSVDLLCPTVCNGTFSISQLLRTMILWLGQQTNLDKITFWGAGTGK